MTPDRSKQRSDWLARARARSLDDEEWALGSMEPRSDAERVMRRFRERWVERWVLDKVPADRARVREWTRAVLELLRAHHPHNERTQLLVAEALLAVTLYDAEHQYPWGKNEISPSSRAVVGLKEAAQAIASAYSGRPQLTMRRFCELMHQTDVPRDAFDAATTITLG